jgi:hypothetical protein
MLMAFCKACYADLVRDDASGFAVDEDGKAVCPALNPEGATRGKPHKVFVEGRSHWSTGEDDPSLSRQTNKRINVGVWVLWLVIVPIPLIAVAVRALGHH